MTDEQMNECRQQKAKALLARKHLLEVAMALKSANIVSKEEYFGTPDVANYIREAVHKLDFALDQFELFLKEAK